MGSLRIGLDIGFSLVRRTCGVSANLDVLPTYGGQKVLLTAEDGTQVSCKRLKLSEAKRWLNELRVAGLLDGAILVLDGMLAPGGPPRIERNVDHACMTGDFANRAVPASVVGGGQRLVEATAELCIAAAGCLSGSSYCFSPLLSQAEHMPSVLETNPVIGLAVSVPMVEDVNRLPSRNRVIHLSGHKIQAKSDYYWVIGGGDRVAAVLGVPDVAAVRDHELRAGLFCLGVAVQIAGEARDSSQTVCVGDSATGTYLLLGPIHPSWEDEVHRIGIVAA